MKQLNGKTVKSVRKQVRGHYNYVEYVITFTDGSKIRFWGDSNADVNVEVIKKGTTSHAESTDA